MVARLYFMAHHNWEWVLIDSVAILVGSDSFYAFASVFKETLGEGSKTAVRNILKR